MVSTVKKIKELNSKFSLFSNPDTEEGAKIASFGEFHLIRLNLHQRYDYQHFLDLAYDVCFVTIITGGTIKFLAAFVKRTMYNQMHVELRNLKKAPYSLCEETLPHHLLSLSEDLSLDCQLAVQAYQNILSSENFTILQWRVINNKSWAEIVALLADQGIVRSVTSLRKMSSRAMPKIKEEYYRLRRENGI